MYRDDDEADNDELTDEPTLPTQIALGIDAGAYLTSTFGKGRYLKSFLLNLSKDPRISPILIADEPLYETLKRRFRNTAVAVALPAEIARGKLDAVWYPWGDMPFACDAPALLTLHDAGPFSKGPFSATEGVIANLQKRRLVGKNVRRAERILALSSWSRKKLSTAIDIDPAAIDIVSPLPDAFWTPGPQELPYESLGEMPFVLVVAGWKSQHDMDLAVRVFEKTFRKSDVQLVVCGPLDAQCQARFDRLPHRLHLSGTLNDGQLRSLYRNADLMLHPVAKSHWSQTCAEALCCGTPLIGADAGSVQGIVGEAGRLVDPADFNAWCDAADELFYDADYCAQLREQARLSWGNMTRNTGMENLTAAIVALIDTADDAEETAAESMFTT